MMPNEFRPSSVSGRLMTDEEKNYFGTRLIEARNDILAALAPLLGFSQKLDNDNDVAEPEFTRVRERYYKFVKPVWEAESEREEERAARALRREVRSWDCVELLCWGPTLYFETVRKLSRLDELRETLRRGEIKMVQDQTAGVLKSLRCSEREARRSVELAAKIMPEFLRARDVFVEMNQRLVYTVIKLYVNRGLPREDLVQEGKIGLISAADRYNSKIGFKFSTLAVMWIKQALTRAINSQNYTVRVPEGVCKELRDSVINGIDRPDLSFGAQSAYQIMSGKIYDIDDVNMNDQAFSVSSDVRENIFEKDSIKVIEEVIEEKIETQKWKDVLKMRYGLYGCEVMTLEQTANILSICRERVRQIESVAIKVLRSDSRIKALETDLD